MTGWLGVSCSKSASQIAVLHDGQLRGLVRIEELLSAARDVPLVSVMDLDPPNIDPAFGSGPLATLVQDLLSIAIYFGVATLVFF